jgi:hypothetical protein
LRFAAEAEDGVVSSGIIKQLVSGSSESSPVSPRDEPFACHFANLQQYLPRILSLSLSYISMDPELYS